MICPLRCFAWHLMGRQYGKGVTCDGCCMLVTALHCFALHCFALLCIALLCIALLCCAPAWEARVTGHGRPEEPSHGGLGMAQRNPATGALEGQRNPAEEPSHGESSRPPARGWPCALLYFALLGGFPEDSPRNPARGTRRSRPRPKVTVRTPSTGGQLEKRSYPRKGGHCGAEVNQYDALLCVFVALLHFASCCFTLQWFALHCFALLGFALQCFALLCFALHCLALRCFPLYCIALLVFALLSFALRCFALL